MNLGLNVIDSSQRRTILLALLVTGGILVIDSSAVNLDGYLMIEVAFFGTAGSRSYAERDNSFLGLIVNGNKYLIDCAGSPVHKAERAKFDWTSIDGVILTHWHVDHVYGLPSLVQHLKFIGRTDTLSIFCLETVAEKLASLSEVFNLSPSRGYPVMEIHPVIAGEESPFIIRSDHAIFPISGKHSIPSFGVRVDDFISGKKVVYSSDTWRSEAILAAAMDADLLIHEASFLDEDLPEARVLGHCTAGEAGRIARRCRAKQLALIHLHREKEIEIQRFNQEAELEYGAKVHIPDDLSWLRVE